MECNIAKLIVMTRYFHLLETRIVLRTILSAGVFAVLVLACAGMVAGATWDVYPGDSIQGAIDGAGAGDMKMFM